MDNAIAVISLLAGMVGLLAPANAQPADEAPYRALVAPDGVQRVEITGGDYFFKPRHIVVKARTPVELVVRAEPGIAPHRFVLKAPETGVDIEAEMSREPKRYAFTPTATGRYAFHCPNRLLMFKSHRERGMEGILEVVEP
jgi:plastocyanin